MNALEKRKGRTMTGVVVSDKNDKTIVVRVETLVKHPLLKNMFAGVKNSQPMTRTMTAAWAIW